MKLNPGDVEIEVIGRDDFLDNVFDYNRGEHLTILGPTGNGKTWLAMQLLERVATPEVPAVVLVMKPKDDTSRDFAKANGFVIVKDWPPPPHVRIQKKPPGYILWPDHVHDPDVDLPRHRMIFRRAVLDAYKKGNRILFADELFSLCAELNLPKEIITVWSKGRSMGTAVWGASQRPSDIPLWAYSQATHLFLGADKDVRARDRFAQIGGVDPDLTKYAVDHLRKHQWVYIHQTSGTMCIVDP